MYFAKQQLNILKEKMTPCVWLHLRDSIFMCETVKVASMPVISGIQRRETNSPLHSPFLSMLQKDPRFFLSRQNIFYHTLKGRKRTTSVLRSIFLAKSFSCSWCYEKLFLWMLARRIFLHCSVPPMWMIKNAKLHNAEKDTLASIQEHPGLISFMYAAWETSDSECTLLEAWFIHNFF